MFVSVVTTLPILQPTDVGAATTAASKGTGDFTWQTQSFLYYRSLAHCFQYSSLSNSVNSNQIKAVDAKAGKWFTSGGPTTFQTSPTAPALGVYMRDATNGDALDVGADGKANCDNASLVSSALSVWGLNAIDLLCNSGFRRVDLGASQTVQTCKDGSGDFERRDGGNNNNVAKFTAYIKNQVYGGSEPDLSKAQWYIYYRHSLAKSCITNIDTKAPGSEVYGSDNPYGYNNVKWVDITTPMSIKTGSYIGGWKTDTNVVLRTGAAPDFNSYEKNCAEVVTLMNGYANDYLTWAQLAGPEAAKAADSKEIGLNRTSDNKTTCALEGVGWIVCPVATFLGTMTDGLFGVLTTLLSFTPLTTTNSPTYDTWQAMRNLANAAFVVAFLLIIFSQLTSVGINNYGVKKLLPRIVIAAILVNLSYFICSIAVDLSNILGYSMQSLFTNAIPATANSSGNNLDGWGELVGWIIAGGIGGLGALSIVAAGGWIPALALLLPILVTALFAAVTVVLVLAARQAILVIMIVISPLAFVAYLLPNTEDLFTKWRKLFTTLLLLFPIISLVFGGSQLAAAIIRADTHNPLIYILSLGVQVIPFFLVPLIMKASGGVLSRFGGMVNNPNKGPFDRLRKGAEGIQQRAKTRTADKVMNSNRRFSPQRAFLRHSAKVESIDQNQARELNRAKTNYIADEAQNNSAFLGKMTAGGGAGAEGRALGAAANISAKLEAEEVTAASAIIKSLNLSQSEARDLANGGAVSRTTAGVTKTVANSADDLSLRIAARQQVVGSNDVKGINDLIDSSAGWSEKDRVSLSDTLSSASSRPSYIGQGALAKMRSGAATGPMKMMNAEEMIEAAIRDNVYSAAKIAAADKDELNVVANVAVASSAISTPEKQRLVNNATTALTDPELSRTITKNLENVRHVQTNTSPAPLA